MMTSKQGSLFGARGFTLIELLVVMLAIAVLVAGSWPSLGIFRESHSLERAAKMMRSMLQVARTQAITHGVHSRLLVNMDESDSEACLRWVGVMIEDLSVARGWKSVDQGVYLPEFARVVPQSGAADFSEQWPADGWRSVYKIRNSDSSDDSAVFALEYPLENTVEEGSDAGVPWMCFQFAPNGRLSAVIWQGGGLPPASARIVLASCRLRDGRVIFEDHQKTIAVMLKKDGSSFQTSEEDLLD